MIFVDDAPMRLLQEMSGQDWERHADSCEDSSCLTAQLLKERLRFKSWGTIAQTRHALELAERADVARVSGDSDASMCSLYLGAAWLQAPQLLAPLSGVVQDPVDDPLKSQRFVCSAVCDALNTVDLNNPRIRRLAEPALELLFTIKEAAGAVESCETPELRQWCRMVSQLNVPPEVVVVKKEEEEEALQPPTPQKAAQKERPDHSPQKTCKPNLGTLEKRQRMLQKGAQVPPLQLPVCKPGLGRDSRKKKEDAKLDGKKKLKCISKAFARGVLKR